MALRAPSRRRTKRKARVRLRTLHSVQAAVSAALRRHRARVIWKAGRRGGKTTGVSTICNEAWLAGLQVRYFAPRAEQTETFWREVERALRPLEGAGVRIDRSTYTVEVPGTKQILRARTAWDPDGMRGAAGDILVLDEFQLMHESVWDEVVAPMRMDTGGSVLFLFTPPSVRSQKQSKARDKMYAVKFWNERKDDPRWVKFESTSHDNPHLDRETVEDMALDMTPIAYRQEILAEIIDEVPGALWKRGWFDKGRYRPVPRITEAVRDEDGVQIGAQVVPDLAAVFIAVDPAGGNDEIGIVAAGRDRAGNGYVLEDLTVPGATLPADWAGVAVEAFHRWQADAIVGEENYGGEMVRATIRQVDPRVPYERAFATRGKFLRAHPISLLYQRGTADDPRGLGRERTIYHVQSMPQLENEMCMWTDDSGWSPNRLDAAVWGLTKAMKMPARLYVAG
ncbi:MAG: hypothetical protein OXG72_16615 [Acidobacteria bacterium]|nr:hypothetical protein [Acidobacteriota bacterium]